MSTPPPNVSTITPLWSPDATRVQQAWLTQFRKYIAAQYDMVIPDDRALYQWSIDHMADFWSCMWDYAGVVGDKGDRILVDGDKMPGAQFFPDARLNYAENLLHNFSAKNEIVFWGENLLKRRVDGGIVCAVVSKVQQALHAAHIQPGDRVAALMPNTPEAVMAMLGVTSVGAIWSSASPDFGVQGIVDRFGQIAPRILLMVDGYYYNGKWVDCTDKIKQVNEALPEIEQIIIVPYDGEKVNLSAPIDGVLDWYSWLSAFAPMALSFVRVPFNHPAFILFSSGTTGVPKCIIHGTGGTLIQHIKEHRLQCDIKPHDRVFYFTTCSWMMWNWLVSAMASGADLMLYDGSPFAPNGQILFDYVDQENITLFGTSAKFIDTLHKQNQSPKDTHHLTSLRTLTSTGSPLVHESFVYIYTHIKSDIHVASISGGTDIISCFLIGYPTQPVYSGQLQGAGLGYAIEVWRADGTQAAIGEKGELVCTKPFPSMPVGFWNDADQSKYRKAYFTQFAHVWHHGDYIEKTPQGGYIIHGRSDATLNPGGVRIGTAEIYRQVEAMPQIVESIAVGQRWGDDERVVLAVVLRDGVVLDEALKQAIKQQIKQGTTPRHVPAKIIQVTDIPRTKNGKISEIAARDTINGKEVANTEALANASVLAEFRNRPELQQD